VEMISNEIHISSLLVCQVDGNSQVRVPLGTPVLGLKFSILHILFLYFLMGSFQGQALKLPILFGDYYG
jgi:hypothetical protein